MTSIKIIIRRQICMQKYTTLNNFLTYVGKPNRSFSSLGRWFFEFWHRVNFLADASCVKQDRFLTVALIRFESKGDRSTHFPVLYLPPSLFPYSNIPSYTLLQNICIFVTNSHLKFREGFSQHYFMSHFNWLNFL